MSSDQILDDLHMEVKSFIAKANSKQAAHGETIEAMQRQLDAVDLLAQGRTGGGSFTGGGASGGALLLKELNQPANLDQLTRGGRVTFELKGLLESKAVISSAGLFTPDAARGVDPSGRYAYELRRNLASLPVDTGSVFALRETGYTNNAAAQVETSPKGESTFTFTGRTIPVTTIAHFVNVSKQSLDDVAGLGQFLDQSLIWGLEKRIENSILYGDGTTTLGGFNVNKTALDMTILSAARGYDVATLIAGGQVQLRRTGYNASHVVLNPTDWFRLLTTRSTTGEYIIANPTIVLGMLMWGLKVILSPEVTIGQAFVFDAGRILMRERQTVTVDISDSHGSNFTSNLLTIRAEWRGALVIQQTGGIIEVPLVSSPS